MNKEPTDLILHVVFYAISFECHQMNCFSFVLSIDVKSFHGIEFLRCFGFVGTHFFFFCVNRIECFSLYFCDSAIYGMVKYKNRMEYKIEAKNKH